MYKTNDAVVGIKIDKNGFYFIICYRQIVTCSGIVYRKEPHGCQFDGCIVVSRSTM
jgi:hypothetical protein